MFWIHLTLRLRPFLRARKNPASPHSNSREKGGSHALFALRPRVPTLQDIGATRAAPAGFAPGEPLPGNLTAYLLSGRRGRDLDMLVGGRPAFPPPRAGRGASLRASSPSVVDTVTRGCGSSRWVVRSLWEIRAMFWGLPQIRALPRNIRSDPGFPSPYIAVAAVRFRTLIRLKGAVLISAPILPVYRNSGRPL